MVAGATPIQNNFKDFRRYEFTPLSTVPSYGEAPIGLVIARL